MPDLILGPRHQTIEKNRSKRIREESVESVASGSRSGNESVGEGNDAVETTQTSYSRANTSVWNAQTIPAVFTSSAAGIPRSQDGLPSEGSMSWSGLDFSSDQDFSQPYFQLSNLLFDTSSTSRQTMPVQASTSVTRTDNGQNNEDAQSADQAVSEMWSILFGSTAQMNSLPYSSSVPPQPPRPITSNPPLLPQFSFTLPSLMPAASSGSSNSAADSAASRAPDLGYLHHYLNVVLPLQYRFAFKLMAEIVAPLAMSRPQVLTSASSLAALHLAAKRTMRPYHMTTLDTSTSSMDTDAIVAFTSHQEATDKLKFLSGSDLTNEDVIVSALFAISFHLFSGGTAKGWADNLATARRCLSSALAASPEVTLGINK